MTPSPDHIRADFMERVVLDTNKEPWIPSPQIGVARRMLDRIGGEVARATSLVRYDPGSNFPPHTHGGGEEYLVLDGTFSDNAGDFPQGTYVRNPPGSRHAPYTDRGCTILVKLCQMRAEDSKFVVTDTNAPDGWEEAAPGMKRLLLFSQDDGTEDVAIEELRAGARFATEKLEGGEEIFLLSGTLADEYGTYGRGTWIRNPPGFERMLQSKTDCRYWVKRGHLGNPVWNRN